MNDRRGGEGRQMRRQTPPDQQTPNQRLTVGEAVNNILGAIIAQRPTIEAMLPVDVTFERFHSTIFMLLRHNPDILACTTSSIINCCFRAAYDGVNLDGVEAAAIPSNNKYKGPDGREAWRKEARYNIMVAGIRKQIMETGLFRSVETILVYDNEEFESWIEADKRHVRHRQKLSNRGGLAGAYSMATYLAGGVSYEIMGEDDIIALKKFATQKGKVWEGPMESEMWRKAVIRRHRKTLLGGKAKPDAEEIDLYPENPANISAQPAPRQRPNRADYYLSDQKGTESGVDLDFGFGEADRRMAETFHQMDEQASAQKTAKADENSQSRQGKGQNGRKPAENRASKVDENTSDGRKQGHASADSGPGLPSSPDEWAAWERSVRDAIFSAVCVDDLNSYWREQSDVLQAAATALANSISEAFSDRLSDLASDPPASGTGTAQGGLGLPDGDSSEA